MSENQQQNNEPSGSFFDQLMFGPPRESINRAEQPDKEQEIPKEQAQSTTSQGNKQAQEIDLAQMMQQFDTLMGYANKLGPSLKKLGPLVDLVKQFGGPKK